MQEAQQTQRALDDKRGQERRVEKSFQQVMRERSEREQAKESQAQQAAKDQPKPDEAKQGQPKAPPRPPLSQAELLRRSALAKALIGQQGEQARAQGHRAEAQAQATRGEDALARSAEERERVEKDTGEIEDRGERAVEEKQGEIKREGAGAGGRVDPDEQRQRRQPGSDDSGKDERRGPEVQGVKGAPSPHVVQIPREIIEKLVKAIYSAVNADGRTSLMVTLKGGALEGVRLQVNAEGGKVQCTIEGCDAKLGRALKQGQGALKAALGQRGLTLTKLEVRS